MNSLILKVIAFPLVILISDIIFDQIYFPRLYEPIVIGLILALVSHTVEILLLKQGRFWINTLLDFIISTLIIYYMCYFLPGARISITGALFAALLVNILEYFQHAWLIRNGRVKKFD